MAKSQSNGARGEKIYVFKIDWAHATGTVHYTSALVSQSQDVSKIERQLNANYDFADGLVPAEDVTVGFNTAHDRQLDIKIDKPSDKMRFIFQLPPSGEFDLRFFKSSSFSAVRTRPRLKMRKVFQDVRTSNDRKTASFLLNIKALKKTRLCKQVEREMSSHRDRIALHEKPSIALPLGFDLVEDKTGLTGWVLPRDSHNKSILVHGGPHPPTSAFITIPLNA
ncbi:hypothetical protein [Pontixanthobacter sp.]|uniref:hypothetical protein n=1 Tax=Pontixanthobacter sp. TaxID=2792078 RepID=UPI003C7DCB14